MHPAGIRKQEDRPEVEACWAEVEKRRCTLVSLGWTSLDTEAIQSSSFGSWPSIHSLWSVTLDVDMDLFASVCGICTLHSKLKVWSMSQFLTEGLHTDVSHTVAGMLVPYSPHIY